ncbi:MAG: hypothetical protein ACRC68_06380 [Clostridium sp.]
MNKNLHLKFGKVKILAIAVLTLTILGGCSSTNKNALVLPTSLDESVNSIVPNGEARSSYSEEIVSKVYTSDNKSYDLTLKQTVPFLEKLDAIDKLTNDMTYVSNSKGNAFTQPLNTKVKNLTYVKELPVNSSDSLTNLMFTLGIDDTKKQVISDTSFALTIVDNKDSGKIILSEKEKSILTIIYPNINLDEVQSNLSIVYEEAVTNKNNSIDTKGQPLLPLDDKTSLSTIAYKEDGSEIFKLLLTITQK